MSKFKVVITDYNYENNEIEKNELEKIDAEVLDYHCKTEEEVIKVAEDADAIMCLFTPITEKIISSLTNCKVIARYGVGIDNIDVDAATNHNICVTNVPGYCLDEVSDHTILLLLAAARKLGYVVDSVKKGLWDYKEAKPINRLRGRTLGLIGFGNIPRLVADKIKPFGVNVIAYDPYIPQQQIDSTEVKIVDFKTLLKESDYISIHAPLTEKTKHMFNEEVFSHMEKKPYIINTSRGALIDENDLMRALEDGYVSGAALDVTEKEPISKYNPLIDMNNVIITPHYAWYSEESEKLLKIKAAKQVVSVLSGYYPEYLVNKAVKTKLSLR